MIVNNQPRMSVRSLNRGRLSMTRSLGAPAPDPTQPAPAGYAWQYAANVGILIPSTPPSSLSTVPFDGMAWVQYGGKPALVPSQYAALFQSPQQPASSGVNVVAGSVWNPSTQGPLPVLAGGLTWQLQSDGQYIAVQPAVPGLPAAGTSTPGSMTLFGIDFTQPSFFGLPLWMVAAGGLAGAYFVFGGGGGGGYVPRPRRGRF